ncbi:MAG: cysteine--tRNA ligase [Deltaproteobacteria bacterium]|nr:cysteine--tRNA ligase [Deltaproteobacteria bacterium]
MALRVYNTATRHKDDFEPLEPGKVRMYVCGVTVYDVCHIGHARAYVAFDVIQRYLRWSGYDVTYVRNFTDVDDKIIARANEKGIPVTELTDRFIAEFHEDMDALGVQRADIEPRVTDHIPDIVETVKRIVENGHGYVEGGDVYYDITSYPAYLALSGRKLDDMVAGASERVEAETVKHHPMDFALWKASKPGEPAWDSPWGPGRPGWHIECSTMSSKYLGDVFDIHGGGQDLIFPHHENERAQSWAASGKEFVRYWCHNGFVNVSGEKMAKSLKNFFTIKDVLKQFHPESLRYFLLTTHYRSPINFTQSGIEEAENRVEYLYETACAARTFLGKVNAQPAPDELESIRARFRKAMDDDFNTAAALGGLADDARSLNEALALKGKGPEKSARVATLNAAILEQGKVLGLCQRDMDETRATCQAFKVRRKGLDSKVIDGLVIQRNEARAARDFAAADAVRDRLMKMGVQVMDTPEGTRWKVI